MNYAAPINLIDQFGAEEIAQRADRGTPRLVTAEMLAVAAAGGGLVDYTPEEQAATLAALEVVNARLLDAESVINGYLATRYTVPLAAVPRLVTMIACDLARYALYDDIVPTTVADRNKNAIKQLEAIAKGLISLGVDTSGNRPAANDAAQISSVTPAFRRTETGGFI